MSKSNKRKRARWALASPPILPKSDSDPSLISRQMPMTPASNNNNVVSSSFCKFVSLHDWWLHKAQGNGLAVGGVASAEVPKLKAREFYSSMIKKRWEANVVETIDGITITLTGFINRCRTHGNGIPLEVCDRFLFGFPFNWEDYVAYCSGEESTVHGSFGNRLFSHKIADGVLPLSVDDRHVTRVNDLLLSDFRNLSHGLLPGSVCDTMLRETWSNAFRRSDHPMCSKMENDILEKEGKGEEEGWRKGASKRKSEDITWFVEADKKKKGKGPWVEEVERNPSSAKGGGAKENGIRDEVVLVNSEKWKRILDNI